MNLDAHHLQVLGGFHPEPGEEGFPPGTRTLLLLGPLEPGFWGHMQAHADWSHPDPIDDWSRRTIGRIACDLGAKAIFPFGGPPWHPFYRWALRTGRIWESPVKLLIQSDQGLMVSFRGALALKDRIDIPPPLPRPCETCAAPCLTACPASALGPQGYDVPACHAHLDGPGTPCLTGGCLTRRACPLSAAYARLEVQSAYHMGRFHKTG